MYLNSIGTSSTPVDQNRTITYLPFQGIGIRQAFGEFSWTIPDAMVLKQVVLLPENIGSGNDKDTHIVWELLVESAPIDPDTGLGVLQTRASLTYINSSPDTSPPPSNPMAPEDSRGDVWDLGLVILKNARIQLKISVSNFSGSGTAANSYNCGLVGTWLRDIPE